MAFRDYDLAFRQELNSGRSCWSGPLFAGARAARRASAAHPDYLLSLPARTSCHVGLADLLTDQDGAMRRYQVAPPYQPAADLAAGAPRSRWALLAIRAAGLDAAARE
jgi:hypothetical protein